MEHTLTLLKRHRKLRYRCRGTFWNSQTKGSGKASCQRMSKDHKGSGYSKSQLNLVDRPRLPINLCKSRTYIYWFRKWTSSCNNPVRVGVIDSNFHPKIIQAQRFPAWTSEALTPITRKVLLPAAFPKMVHSIQSCQYASYTWLHSKRPWKGLTFLEEHHVPVRHRKQLGIIRIKYKSHQQTLQVHFTS